MTKHKDHANIHRVKRSARMCGRTGDNCEEGTPVPIPNTEVKLFSPDDTARAAAWENRKSPFHPPTWAFFCAYLYTLLTAWVELFLIALPVPAGPVSVSVASADSA